MELGIGRLMVNVLRARKLPEIKRKKNGPPDAFAVLTYDSLQFETEMAKHNHKPVFLQEFAFTVSDMRSSFSVALFGVSGHVRASRDLSLMALSSSITQDMSSLSAVAFA